MNAADFPFVAGVDRASAAKALTALGILAGHARADPLATVAMTGAALLPALGEALDAAGDGPVVVDLRRDVAGYSGRSGALPAADVLAKAWDHAVQGRAFPRLALRSARGDPRWLVRQLSLPRLGAASVFVDPGQRAGRRGWSFGEPLRALVVGDDALAATVRASLASLRTSRDDAARVRLGASRGGPDVLVVATSFADAVSTLRDSNVTPSLLVVPSMPAGDWEQDVAAPLMELRQRTLTGGVVFSSVEPSHRAAWIADLLTRLLSEPIDVAVFQASRATPGTALLVVHRDALREQRPGEVRRRPVRQSIAAASLQIAVRMPFGRRHQLMTMAPPGPPLGYEERMFRRGAAAAIDADDVGADGAEFEAPDPEPQPRFIQTRITARPDAAATGTHFRSTRVFMPNALHVVHVRIGPRDHRRWRSVPGVFPDWTLPEPDRPQTLTVVLSAPGMLPEPQVGQVVLPSRGASTACRFHIRTSQRGEVEARILVLHRGRIVQTAVLSGAVGEGEKAALRLEPEMQIRSFDGLSSRPAFDAALLVNHTGDGEPTVTSIGKDGASASVWSLQGVDGWIRETRNRLEEMVRAPDKYLTLDATDSVNLLWALANAGVTLYDALTVDNATRETRPIWDAARLQVVSAKSESYLPLEFAYTRPAPVNGAPLCVNARAALLEGKCQPGCPQNVESVVCPLRFWGLSKVIERHPYNPDRLPKNLRAEYEVRNDPVAARDRLDSFQTAALATSARVDEFDSTATETLCARLGALLQNRPAQTWQQWRQTIAGMSPQLLVLLPHNDLDDSGLAALFIGAGDALLASQVTADIVGIPQGARVVLLLGCRTGSTDIPFESYPAVFRRAGAALVVTALSSILGRHAAPVAAALVEALLQRGSAEGTEAFGDVLLDVRRRLMADDRLMAIVLIAYGDADWRIGAGP